MRKSNAITAVPMRIKEELPLSRVYNVGMSGGEHDGNVT
jgi:hypothetical protein